MNKSKKEGTSKQFRWTKPMERIFLEILAEEAQKGNKPSNTFKSHALARVASTISEKFNVECERNHVDNHLRTVKNIWQIISKIRADSGFGWDDNLKMITCDQNTYDEAVTAHPKYEQFLNKKIEMYDEMALVVGKDMATGSFAKSFADIDLDDVHGIDSSPLGFETEFNEKVREKASSSIGTSQPRSHRKRKSILASDNDDEKLDNMAEKLGEIATAIKKFTDNQVSTEHLYEEVMSMEGFDEESLVAAFDYLVEHEKQAKAFMVKNKNLKRLWLDKFFRNVT